MLVHSGDSHGGHYCAFIRPQPGGNWFKFDDDRVTRCSQKEAMDDNFGVELPDPSTPLKWRPGRMATDSFNACRLPRLMYASYPP